MGLYRVINQYIGLYWDHQQEKGTYPYCNMATALPGQRG